MNAKLLLREKDVNAEYGPTVPWLRKMRRLRGGPRFLRIGKMIFYRREDLEAFFTAHLIETHKDTQREESE